MLSKLVRLLVPCLLAAVSLQSDAGTVDPRLAKHDICGRFEVLHVNGINTTIEDAGRNLEALALAYGNGHEEHLLQYGLAYNQTDWALADIRQAFAQIAASYPGISYRQWLRAVISGIWPESLPADAIAEIVGSLGVLLGLDRPIPTDDPALARMLQQIAQLHPDNRGRMLIVPHSQGNIYATVLYDMLTSATPGPVKILIGQVDIVGVAVPLTRENLRGTGHYVTSRQDQIINLVRLIVPATLPPVVNLRPVDALGHSFVDVYLAQDRARSQIVAKMEVALNGLRSGLSDADGLALRNYVVASSAHWLKCGPDTSPSAPPGTRPCQTPAGIFTADVILTSIPGTVGWGARGGSIGDNEAAAQDIVTQCVALYNAENLRRRLEGESLNFRISGCPGDNFGSMASLAWSIHSSDGIGFRIAPWYDILDSWMGETIGERVWMQGHMTCRGVP